MDERYKTAKTATAPVKVSKDKMLEELERMKQRRAVNPERDCVRIMTRKI